MKDKLIKTVGRFVVYEKYGNVSLSFQKWKIFNGV